MKKFLDSDAGTLAVVIFVIATFCFLSHGCGETKAAIKAATSMPVPTEISNLDLDQARAYATTLRGKLAEADSKVADEEKRIEEKRYEYLRTLARWVCGLSILLGVLAAGAAIWLRSKALAGLAASCLGMLIMGMLTDWIIAHRILAMSVVGIITAGIVSVVLWHAHRRGNGLEKAIKVAEYLKPKTEDEGQKRYRRDQQKNIVGKSAKVIEEFRDRLMKKEYNKVG